MAVSRKHVVNEVLVLVLVIHFRLPKFHHRLSDALFHTPMNGDDKVREPVLRASCPIKTRVPFQSRLMKARSTIRVIRLAVSQRIDSVAAVHSR